MSWKQITSKFEGICHECGKSYVKGQTVMYNGGQPYGKRIRHIACHHSAPDNAPDSAPDNEGRHLSEFVSPEIRENLLTTPHKELSDELDLGLYNDINWPTVSEAELREFGAQEIRVIARHVNTVYGYGAEGKALGSIRKADAIRFIRTGQLPGDDAPAPQPKVETPTPKPNAPKPNAPKRDKSTLGPMEQMILDIVEEHATVKQDLDDIKQSLMDWARENISLHKTEIELRRDNDVVTIDADRAHYKLPLLLKAANARHLHDGSRLNIMLVGEPGTGKSHAVRAVAEALGLPFSSMSVNAEMSKYDILGFKSPIDGSYHSSPFVTAYTEGHAFLLDEMDAAHPNVLTVVNDAIANGAVTLPSGEVAKRHENFILIGGANTYGHGATKQHAGRARQDGATLDRFVVINWDFDEHLMMLLNGISPDDVGVSKPRIDMTGQPFTAQLKIQFATFFQKVRRVMQDGKLGDSAYHVGARSMMQAMALLREEIPFEIVKDMTVYKGMPEAIREQVINQVAAL